MALSARILIVLLLAACGGSESPAGVTVPASASDFAAPVKTKLASLSVTEFKVRDAAAVGAKACAVGEVEQLEVTVCEFEASAAEAGAKRLKSELAGAQSGAVRTNGALVVAIADRKKVDPRGQALNRVLASLDDE